VPEVIGAHPSTNASGPPHYLQRPVLVAVLNPREGDVDFVVPQERRSEPDRWSGTLSGQQETAMLEDSPSRHILPSPPTTLPLLRVPSRHPRFELRVLPRTPAVDATKAELSSALVTMVGGSRPLVSPTQVLEYLAMHFQVAAEEVWVRRSYPDDFLMLFNGAPKTHRLAVSPSSFSVSVGTPAHSSPRHGTKSFWPSITYRRTFGHRRLSRQPLAPLASVLRLPRRL
jgi:hypothetical protein